MFRIFLATFLVGMGIAQADESTFTLERGDTFEGTVCTKYVESSPKALDQCAREIMLVNKTRFNRNEWSSVGEVDKRLARYARPGEYILPASIQAVPKKEGASSYLSEDLVNPLTMVVLGHTFSEGKEKKDEKEIISPLPNSQVSAHAQEVQEQVVRRTDHLTKPFQEEEKRSLLTVNSTKQTVSSTLLGNFWSHFFPSKDSGSVPLATTRANVFADSNNASIENLKERNESLMRTSSTAIILLVGFILWNSFFFLRRLFIDFEKRGVFYRIFGIPPSMQQKIRHYREGEVIKSQRYYRHLSEKLAQENAQLKAIFESRDHHRLIRGSDGFWYPTKKMREGELKRGRDRVYPLSPKERNIDNPFTQTQEAA
jgi:hypothetical protein